MKGLFHGIGVDDFEDFSHEPVRSPQERDDPTPNSTVEEKRAERSPSVAEKKGTLETERLKVRPNTAVNTGRTVASNKTTIVSKPTVSTNLTINVN